MTVAGLNVYPIKSLRGVARRDSLVEPRGLADDRRMMLVDADGGFVSQREVHRLALFEVFEDPSGWRVAAPGKGETFVLRDSELEAVDVTVWQSTLTARRISDDADAWFSAALEMATRLVRMSGESERTINPAFAPEGSPVSFADACPVLVAGSASLQHLNDQLDAPIEMRRFRPNTIVEGSSPHEEDNWSAIEIGNVKLVPTKRCGRCLVTTIDPETGEPGQEPLRTLNGYRKLDQSVDFGMYYRPIRCGEIRVGDPIRVEPKEAGATSSG